MPPMAPMLLSAQAPSPAGTRERPDVRKLALVKQRLAFGIGLRGELAQMIALTVAGISGGGRMVKGWVGEDFSPGIWLCATGRSS